MVDHPLQPQPRKNMRLSVEPKSRKSWLFGRFALGGGDRHARTDPYYKVERDQRIPVGRLGLQRKGNRQLRRMPLAKTCWVFCSIRERAYPSPPNCAERAIFGYLENMGGKQ